jgi:transcriptional regulator with XRE-family HTH domain
MLSIKERFALFVDKSRIPKTEIEKKIGVSNGFVGKIVNGKSSFSVDILERIITEFPNLNPLWLVEGSGQMFREQEIMKEENLEELIERKVKEILAREREVN